MASIVHFKVRRSHWNASHYLHGCRMFPFDRKRCMKDFKYAWMKYVTVSDVTKSMTEMI